MFRFWSVNSIVIAPASTGSGNSTRRAVIATDHTNRGIRSGFMFFGFMLIVVEMKFTAPRMDDTPARCKEKMAKYTDTHKPKKVDCSIFWVSFLGRVNILYPL